MELLSYLTLSMQKIVIDYQLENAIVVKLTYLCVYMLSLTRLTLTLWHATVDRLLQCYHWGWTHGF